jgi:hypothetical protein
MNARRASARAPHAARAVIAAACLAAVWLAVFAAAGASRPMSNEDIVRMTGDHLDPAAIVKAIQAAPATRFDLDPDVMIELRRAGVAEVVLAAMRRAAAAQPPAAGTPGDAAAKPTFPAKVALTLRFAGIEDKPGAEAERPSVQAPARDREGRPITIAFYLLCLDPTHVPDGWMASPLAVLEPRHQLLYFTATAPEDPAAPSGAAAMLRLDLPASVPLEIEPGTHTLQLGLAVRRGEDWAELSQQGARLRVDPGVPVTLQIGVSGRLGGRRTRTSGYRLRLASEPPEALQVTEPENPPPAPLPSGPP